MFKVLLSFGRAGNGQVMLDVASQMFGKAPGKLDITALHLTVGSDVNPLHTENFEEVSFRPIIQEAKKLDVPITTRYAVSTDAGQDIVNIVNKEGFDFLLVGAALSLSDIPTDIEATQYKNTVYERYFRHLKAPRSWFYPGTLLKDKTKMFIEQTKCAVGVFVNRGFVKATNILVPVAGADDLFLAEYARNLQKSTHGSVTFLYGTEGAAGSGGVAEALTGYAAGEKKVVLLADAPFTAGLLSQYNFMLISYPTWNAISDHRKEALQSMPSTLILSKKKAE
ncbi:MAG: hypothetical protein LIP00_08420 [Parabacteroides sp.]|nr:hypothetical protein [Parabacteroides sp.]